MTVVDIRTHIASQALQAIISNTAWFNAIAEAANKVLHVTNKEELSKETKRMCAAHAVGHADALIKELNKRKKIKGRI